MADVDHFMKEAESYSWCLRSAHEQEERGNKWNGVFWRERAREHLIRAFGFGPDDLNSDALKAARLAYDQKTSDMTSVYPTEEPDAGEGPIGYAIRAYLRIYFDAMVAALSTPADTDAAQSELSEARRKAFEEAAAIADAWTSITTTSTALAIAAAIRQRAQEE